MRKAFAAITLLAGTLMLPGQTLSLMEAGVFTEGSEISAAADSIILPAAFMMDPSAIWDALREGSDIGFDGDSLYGYSCNPYYYRCYF